MFNTISKMESSKGEEAQDSDKKFKDVIDATKEAVAIYEKVLKEFPKFVGRSRAMFQLASALKSIDEPQKFLVVVNDLIKQFPGTKDAAKGQLLLGQHIFDKGIFDEALKTYLPLRTIKFPYERNQAKYKIGLIYLADGKHKEALDSFVEVITDKDFKNDENEAEVNLKKKNVRADLKREALIDSVRAYTEVYKENPEAVKFYSNIAPTENLFQEVIEKLAFRYINLKQYLNAIKLLRTLTERTASPEKVLSIYKEVLLMIPLNDRITLPVSEIRYVLEKYVQWRTFYKLPADVARSAEDFFEKQLRDLGTRSHEMGKSEKDPKKAAGFLRNAINFYELYIAVFKDTKFTMKLALNSGDAHFRVSDYLKCGDYYLRAYKSEWGKITDKTKGPIIKNAVFCLQKEKEIFILMN
jgi:tetratricopeptide (TPR) repeat protein